ncbi:SLC13 family permease [Salinibacter sp. 10B]|uniref:SLC13 family permease n=1 Tax=Salinibacter sp. 10B TaxID=1923971 RepID=UPI000CF5369A|nr:SLC13 family permease [Salinibacter sp. 10B]PQJ35346.1 SLC13 family permease [Salinibacter sp. 10B]
MLLSRLPILLTQAAPTFTVDMFVVLGLIAAVLGLFISEIVPIDITALGTMVAVILLEPWTGVGPADGVSGFASTATVTVLAMFILSEGIRRTGVLRRLGNRIVEWAKGSFYKQYGALIGLSGTTAGVINNTPVVAMMIPMAVNLARRTKLSPSKLLMPISFASMLGGMLTLIGTSTSILASDVSARLLGHPFSMFEFTALGAIVLVTGWIYLLTVGHRLVPERIKPQEDLTEEFEISGYLSEVVVTEESPLVGYTVRQALEQLELDVDIVRMERDGKAFAAPLGSKQFRPGDELLLRTNRDTLMQLIRTQKLEPEARTKTFREKDFEIERKGEALAEIVLLSDNPLVGETLRTITFAQRFDALVLAIRRKGELLYDNVDQVPLQGGDTLLVQASGQALKQFERGRSFVVIQADEEASFRTEKLPLALGIIGLVVGLAALEVVPIMVSALGGIVAMVATGCVRPNEVYEAVDWSVIFLLAGLIPLGMAMERSGTAAYLATAITDIGTSLPALVLLFVFYIVTSLVTQVISNNASVILMIPMAVEAAQITGADPFSFVLAVTFGASCALLTPIGYQTNLMVYGPGGYRFTDFVRMGAPLQLLLAFVTCGGIWAIWGV